jgi:hypothetical protein
MKIKISEIIQIVLFIFAMFIIINLNIETEIEQHASDDLAYFIVYKRIIRDGFLSILLFISIIYIEIRQQRLSK